MKSIYINKIAPLCALSLLMVGAASHAQQFSGVVLDADGNRIAKAKVSLVNTKYKVVTDEKGQFTFSDVGVGKVEVHVSAKNFSHINEYFTITDKDMTEVKISLRATVMEVVDVYATPLHSSSIESALPVNVISGDDLRLKQASTLGETLKNEVGVHSSYFGPVASSPIIRGMDGPRVLITQNGLDVGDASRVGPDHAVAAEAGTAQQVEVLRGPSTLFYGSGAIGGVVNVVDNRIPKTIDNQVDYLLKHNDVADESEATLSINTGYKSLALHLDAFWRESNDYKIPGYATAAEDHDEHEEDHDEHEGEETKGILENSASKSSGFTVGSSYLFDAGYIGVSYGRMERTYGIPGHSEHGDEEHEETGTEISEEGAVFGDLVQDRYQLLSEISFEDSFINRLISKAAYTDYQHQEIEGGEVGTQFNNEMLETRFDLYHQAVDGWKGAWTLHYKENDFKAIGEEAFTPPSNTESIAVAWLEEKHVDNVLWQVGVRVEHVELSASGAVDLHDEHDDELDNHNEAAVYFDKQSFTPISASLGAVWEYSTGYNLGFSAAFSQRAPSASELFSNGAHIGTSTYEVGALFTVHEESHEEHHELHVDLSDQNVELETAYNLDLTWRKFEGDFGFVASAFYNHIDDYYYQANTGLFAEDGHDSHDEAVEDDHADESEGLPVYVFQQNNVVMYGVEAELFYQLTPTLKATVFTDYIRAKLTDNDNNNLPRIPPMRVGGQFNYVTDKYSAELSATHYFEQSDTAELESKTSGYTMIDANINFFIDGLGDDMVAFLKVNNITDEEARVHTSFLKNVSPLPARGFTVGIRGSF
ncbi:MULTISPECIES: TonB-dependent receptor [unclassified Colwellia]|uniref:TonB-dependent receptor n=1 Tax=unclassified Colwellia TaxID=196834 RepID=UPI0015F6A54B|nr:MULTISPECIES: TonB-dependent receptor [unclassified Colwellia]MBA6237222.1 TonB-dependent receptor [Colwellia sp. MB02u-11]MBA6254690.1 TonB-dependent receptor [Colwellia sp. MB3u-28]MBA6260418.1 TonB-dependent receptor [Colwellia sp. MB3u-41]MBA6300211.1 TonB-dependent receptor [Colwellia sp. MB3u-22]MBA6304710.1 TonB-dependent receptor [Colwellia sp. MB02u-14]